MSGTAPGLSARRAGPARGGERSEPPGKRSAQRPKGAEATGIAVEIGAKRRLERKARPRSGSPRLIVAFRTLVTIIGTVAGISVRTISSIVVIVRTVMVADTPTTISIGVVTISR